MSLPKLSTPTFELTLPSSGKKVTYRPFFVKEHKVLLAMAEADNEEVIRIVTELVDVCTFNKLNIKNLPYFDIEYIFLQLRAKSISEMVEIILSCECGNSIETSYNIEDVKIEKHPEHTNKILLDGIHGVELKYPKFDDIVNVFASNNTEKIIQIITDSIIGIFDNDTYWNAEDQTPEEIQEFIFSLTKEQFDKIENFFVTAPKVVQVIEADCDKCGKHNIAKLEGLSNFFV